MTTTEPTTAPRSPDAFLDARRAEWQERDARKRQDRATMDSAARERLGHSLEDCDFAMVRLMVEDLALATPAEEVLCLACQGEPAEDSMGSDYVRRGDEGRHACLLPQPMHVMRRDPDTGQRVPHQVFYVPAVDNLLDEDVYWTDDLALALHGRLTIECTRAQQEHLRELWENGQTAREEREAEIGWAKDPGLECACRGVVAASREDGTPDLTDLNITHALACQAAVVATA